MKRTISVLAVGIGAALSLPAEKTFTKDVAPILQKNCQGCHRPGQAAPFSLLTYEQARPWAKAMKSAVLQRKNAASGSPIRTTASLRMTRRWRRAISTPSRPGSTPALRLATPSTCPHRGNSSRGGPYRSPTSSSNSPSPSLCPRTESWSIKYVIIPTGFTEDKWVEHVQAAPTDYSVVHHIVAYVRAPGSYYFKDMPKNEFFEAPPSKKDGPKPPKD
jgi:hypothetical protein